MKATLRATVLFLIISHFAKAQLSGIVSDTQGNPLPFVNVYIDNSFTGTVSNNRGEYRLEIPENTELTIVFQYLGYKTVKQAVDIKKDPVILNIALEETSYGLEEVFISSAENPAHRIIRQAIETRKKNLYKTSGFTADFYSRGMWKMQDVPKRILGQEVGDLDGALDSTRTGIVYLSETISEIAYQRPNKFKERIIASKVSGNDNGFSFNSAEEAEFNFYENTVEVNTHLVSPIASDAFGYYRYSLEGSFYDENHLIYKIHVVPKRPGDRVFQGYVYVVDELWQLYGIELQTTGTAIQIPFVTQINFKQNFSYDKQLGFWIKISQTIHFGFEAFKMKGNGEFTAFYGNYNFQPDFDEGFFTQEIMRIEDNANQKDSIYWNTVRPIPLTTEEAEDYVRRDSIQQIRKSEHYLDSLDGIKNRVSILSPITGYTYTNTFNRYSISYPGVVKATFFNTIQGMSVQGELTYRSWSDEFYTRLFQTNVKANYGFAENKTRLQGSIAWRFNRINRRTVSLSGGSKVEQFNAQNPISPLLNTITSLYFERNYLKAYELNYARLSYSEEVLNGLQLTARIGYEERNVLFNSSYHYFIPYSDRHYTSNNPLQPYHYLSRPFDNHNLLKLQLETRISFSQKYLSYPYAKFNIPNEKYPELLLQYEKGLAASRKSFHYDKIKLTVHQEINLRNKGQASYRLKAGTFLSDKNPAFVDFFHFNGNQTRIGTASPYTEVFNLMPYYRFSTDKSFMEGHWEHDFKGFLLGKVPLLNQLNYNLVLGGHWLIVKNEKPYTEISVGLDNVGIGKFRFFRIDYVHSFYRNTNRGAFIFGLKFLQVLNGL